MLLVNVDDMLKLTNSDIKHKGAKESDTYTFFDTDKFFGALDTLQKGTMLTSDMLADICRASFTEGHLEYSKDLP